MIISAPGQLPYKPSRIISLVPSQTELLYALGLDEEVAGITKFCIHPQHWFESKVRIGGTKNISIKKIEELHSDLVIANKEENVQDQVEAIAQKYSVWLTEINNLDDALQMINDIGLLTQTTTKASILRQNIQDGFNALPVFTPIPAAYLIWKDPYMSVGNDTFIHNMMGYAGFENVFKSQTRYPEVSLQAIRESGAEVVLLSSEPYPFAQKHIIELEQHLPCVQILLVDGELFSWYGSRLLQTPPYFFSLQEKLHR